MKAAHQGVPVASLPNSQAPGFFSNLAQASPPSSSAQVSGPQVTASQITNPAPASLAPLPAASANRPAPTRTSTSTRPEAAAGLDGWLMQRLFGGR
jgi:penicillin-binding protein 1A